MQEHDPSEDEGGESPHIMEGALLLEKSLNQTLLDLYALRSAVQTPISVTSWSHFLDEEVKFVKMVGDLPTRSAGCLAPRLGWVSISSNGSAASITRSLWGPAVFKGPLGPLGAEACA